VLQLLKHAWLWTILPFGTGVKLPAKPIVVEEKRIIAAAVSFIFASPKSWDIKILRLIN